jgi:hypothetical protein
MAELTELGTIRIRALRGIPASAADSLHLVVFTATAGQTTFASGLTSGTFEAKDVTLMCRGVQIPYGYMSVSSSDVVYDDSFVGVTELQDGDVVELRIWT